MEVTREYVLEADNTHAFRSLKAICPRDRFVDESLVHVRRVVRKAEDLESLEEEEPKVVELPTLPPAKKRRLIYKMDVTSEWWIPLFDLDDGHSLVRQNTPEFGQAE